MGLKSGEYGGRKTRLAPLASMAARAAITLWAGKVVHDDDVARAERWGQARLHPGHKNDAIHGLIDDHGRVDAVAAQCGDEGSRLPMSMRHGGDEPLAPARATAAPRHLGGSASLVNKHQPARVEHRLAVLPVDAGGGYVLAFLLGGMRRFS